MSMSADSTRRTGHNTNGAASVVLNMCRPAMLGVSFLRLLEPHALASGEGMGLHWQDWLEDFEHFMKGSQVTDAVQQFIASRNLIGKEIGQIIKELLTRHAIIISRGLQGA
ncbi:hypothetical protein NDU88_002001 [Pleurodeles waltl]|uniref:Uncharacterized protein n=1 Tax=Pleurodeles waltl TaxID=8319 RepID=A0AAV7TJF1_PLEWA|nr:hypothetical protein NDU88_002001 [Pleurodeles waltl]